MALRVVQAVVLQSHTDNHVNPDNLVILSNHFGFTLCLARLYLLHTVLAHQEVIDSIQVLRVEETDFHLAPPVSR